MGWRASLASRWRLSCAQACHEKVRQGHGGRQPHQSEDHRRCRERASRGVSSGDLVSNLTLGFWVHLTDRSREAVIWRTGLYAAWPKGTRRVALQNRLDGILRVRNRIAHNERLFNPKCEQLSPMRVSADALALLGQLCPEAAAYVRGSDKETIEDFLARNPAPVNVRL